MAVHRQAVLLFDEGTDATRTALIRGGKGAGLSDMVALGLPVPPGFTITTGVSRAYAQYGRIPKRIDGQLIRSISQLEQQTGLVFGNPELPLLVSVRSGAAASMPGMMDTVLNVGMNDRVHTALREQYGQQFANDTLRRFIEQFTTSVLDFELDMARVTDDQLLDFFGNDDGLIPWDPHAQLAYAIEAVLKSWNSERALAYRASQGIPNWHGTAVNVQAMVFGNRDDRSGTGVVFSSDPVTGQAGMVGEYLMRAQGEALVSGTTTPLPLSALRDQQPAVFDELTRCVDLLATDRGTIVDVEFTVESGRLYILQVRKATRSALAAATFAVQQVWAKHWSHAEAVASLSAEETSALTGAHFSDATLSAAASQLLATGLPASPGSVSGIVAHSLAAVEQILATGQRAILVREDTSPEDLPAMLKAAAIVTQTGGVTCHAAVVARGLGLPAIVGLAQSHGRNALLPEQTVVSVDGRTGQVFSGELPLETVVVTKEASLFCRWQKESQVAARRLDFSWLDQRVSANERLVSFYLSEAMLREATNTPLEAQARTVYDTVLRETAGCFATYLLVATTGEAAGHYGGTNADQLIPEVVNRLHDEFALSSGRSFSKLVIERLRNLDTAAHIEYLALLGRLFREPRWHTSMGGPKWADIVDTLHDYLAGKFPAAVFVDRVFDLRHNGGRLFDKHQMVSELTDDHRCWAQLEIKKKARTIQELHHQLTQPIRQEFTWRHETLIAYWPNTEVQNLWREGATRKLW